jgi:quercetin dioxygenase-like cupin family protein
MLMHVTRIVSALLVAGGMTLIGSNASGHGTAEAVKPTLSQAIPNIPGKSLVAVEVSYPPGGASRPHRHAQSAFIYAYVVSGRIASQVEGQPERIYKAGESFHEVPGAHHLVSRNASRTEPAKLLAVFVVDTDDKVLTTPDQ